MEHGCSDCKFYRSIGDDVGECRRYPPVILGEFLRIDGRRGAERGEDQDVAMWESANDPTSWSWPVTFGSEWCGEFKPKQERS